VDVPIASAEDTVIRHGRDAVLLAASVTVKTKLKGPGAAGDPLKWPEDELTETPAGNAPLLIDQA
jgi:hypothetical protein